MKTLELGMVSYAYKASYVGAGTGGLWFKASQGLKKKS
jgi:hypothetical protein